MRMRTRIAVVVVLAGAAALGLSSCADHASTPPTSSPSERQIAFDSEDRALAAARDAYLEYRRVAESVLAGGGSDQAQIRKVATGQLLKDELAGDQEFVSKEYRSVGSSTLLSMTLQRARLLAPTEARSVVVAYACIDVSHVEVVDAQGVSVVASDRSPRVGYEVSFDFVDGKLLPSRQDPWNSASVCS